MWTSFVIYFSYNFFFFMFLLLLVYQNSLTQSFLNLQNIVFKKILLISSLFTFLFMFFYLTQLCFIYSSFHWSSNSYNSEFYTPVFNYFSIFTNSTNTTLILDVYYYPFIYVFVLVTFLSVIFCMVYNQTELNSFMIYISFIIVAGYLMFLTDSILLFFMAYEMLLVPSFFILYKYAKTRKTVEASYLMFFWTQFGAMWIILGLLYITLTNQTSSFSLLTPLYFSTTEVNFLFTCFLLGFGVKLPIWPFYGWLPKAHVEASTNFSIFLSGVLVKFAFFGLLKILVSIELEPTFIYAIPFLCIGIFDAVFKLFYQIDLKKLVAYATVVEMHWLTICLISGQSNLLLASFSMLISHAIISSNSFLLVDAISRRFKTRLVTEISSINFTCPKLFLASLVNLLTFVGFPGSLFFVSEFLFFSFVMDFLPLMGILFLVLLYLLAPTFFFRSWMNVLFGYSNVLNKKLPVDLTSRESLLFSSLTILLYWLGYNWQSFLV